MADLEGEFRGSATADLGFAPTGVRFRKGGASVAATATSAAWPPSGPATHVGAVRQVVACEATRLARRADVADGPNQGIALFVIPVQGGQGSGFASRMRGYVFVSLLVGFVYTKGSLGCRTDLSC